MASDGSSKKRPLDLLASLDEAFIVPRSKKISKPNTVPSSQQAYLKKKKNKYKKLPTSQQRISSKTCTGSSNSNEKTSQLSKKKEYDPLYGRLGEDILSIGLSRCSLQGEVKNFNKTSGMNGLLKKYIAKLLKDAKSLQSESNASDKIKNKVLQLDNPIKSSSAFKKSTPFTQALYAKQMSAKKKRQLNLHLLHGDMEYQAAVQLSKIWKSYMSSFLGNDLSSIDQNESMGLHTDKKAMNRIRTKIRTMDLTGCPAKIIQSCNPCNVGLEGVIVSEKQEVVQICRPNGKILTLPKKGSRFCFELDQAQCKVIVDGNWLLEGRKRNAVLNDDV